MQKKNKLIVMCGCPGLGKTHWAQSHKDAIENCKIVSRDDIRFSIVKENEPYFSHEDEVWEKFITEIQEGLDNNENVIADATHLNERSRFKLFNALNLKDIELIAVALTGTLNQALEQNELRKGDKTYVPRSALRRMYYSFVMPDFDEGFDKIYKKIVGDNKIIEKVKE